MNVQIVKEYPSPFGSDNVVLMRGYSKPSSTSDISSSDSLNAAIGKLEKASDTKADSTDVTNKANLKLASSGTTASGEIRFGVDGNGNYGYIKAGADTVTPFKNPTGNKSIGTITQNGEITGIDVEDYATASLEVAVPSPAPHIYGVIWTYGNNTLAFSRTDEAFNFTEPNPYYSGMSGTPSSPFDSKMPWAGMRRVTDSVAGELVEIPKFWYKWTKSGNSLQLQIADAPVAGFNVSPAHADRGDGVGERDYVYVGRYHCASDYKSKSGYSTVRSKSRSTFRNGIHTLRSDVWQYDYAMHMSIAMLVLVEYATWRWDVKIGCGSEAKATTGSTDSMPYHTGTTQSSRTSGSAGVQYRYIENAWSNILGFVDGIYSSGNNWYCIKNPANFSDSSGGTFVGARDSYSGSGTPHYENVDISNVSGFEYALIAKNLVESGSNAIGLYSYGGAVFCHAASDWQGPLSWWNNGSSSMSSSNVGSRLMVLPSLQII